MSRIDEAIRRSQGLGPEEATPAGDDVFMPAWPETAAAESPALNQMPAPAGLTISTKWRDRLASGPSGDSALVEQFRRLAATLHQTRQSQPLRSVMVTSAAPGDGKTLTACNLAFVLAETYGYRVLLMDADLRRPSISNILDLPEGAGLVDALRSPTAHKLALIQLTARLTLLPAGRPTANSIEALVSPRMRLILEEASSKFDWVILDAPPVAASSDARLLSQMVGGTLFVIRAGMTPHAGVQRGIDAVGRDQILGVVLNDVGVSSNEAYYYLAGETKNKR